MIGSSASSKYQEASPPTSSSLSPSAESDTSAPKTPSKNSLLKKTIEKRRASIRATARLQRLAEAKGMQPNVDTSATDATQVVDMINRVHLDDPVSIHRRGFERAKTGILLLFNERRQRGDKVARFLLDIFIPLSVVLIEFVQYIYFMLGSVNQRYHWFDWASFLTFDLDFEIEGFFLQTLKVTIFVGIELLLMSTFVLAFLVSRPLYAYEKIERGTLQSVFSSLVLSLATVFYMPIQRLLWSTIWDSTNVVFIIFGVISISIHLVIGASVALNSFTPDPNASHLFVRTAPYIDTIALLLKTLTAITGLFASVSIYLPVALYLFIGLSLNLLLHKLQPYYNNSINRLRGALYATILYAAIANAVFVMYGHNLTEDLVAVLCFPPMPVTLIVGALAVHPSSVSRRFSSYLQVLFRPYELGHGADLVHALHLDHYLTSAPRLAQYANLLHQTNEDDAAEFFYKKATALNLQGGHNADYAFWLRQLRDGITKGNHDWYMQYAFHRTPDSTIVAVSHEPDIDVSKHMLNWRRWMSARGAVVVHLQLRKTTRYRLPITRHANFPYVIHHLLWSLVGGEHAKSLNTDQVATTLSSLVKFSIGQHLDLDAAHAQGEPDVALLKHLLDPSAFPAPESIEKARKSIRYARLTQLVFQLLCAFVRYHSITPQARTQCPHNTGIDALLFEAHAPLGHLRAEMQQAAAKTRKQTASPNLGSDNGSKAATGGGKGNRTSPTSGQNGSSTGSPADNGTADGAAENPFSSLYPLVLNLVDLHLCDEESMEVLRQLTGRMDGKPFVFVYTWNPHASKELLSHVTDSELYAPNYGVLARAFRNSMVTESSTNAEADENAILRGRGHRSATEVLHKMLGKRQERRKLDRMLVNTVQHERASAETPAAPVVTPSSPSIDKEKETPAGSGVGAPNEENAGGDKVGAKGTTTARNQAGGARTMTSSASSASSSSSSSEEEDSNVDTEMDAEPKELPLRGNNGWSSVHCHIRTQPRQEGDGGPLVDSVPSTEYRKQQEEVLAEVEPGNVRTCRIAAPNYIIRRICFFCMPVVGRFKDHRAVPVPDILDWECLSCSKSMADRIEGSLQAFADAFPLLQLLSVAVAGCGDTVPYVLLMHAYKESVKAQPQRVANVGMAWRALELLKLTAWGDEPGTVMFRSSVVQTVVYLNMDMITREKKHMLFVDVCSHPGTPGLPRYSLIWQYDHVCKSNDITRMLEIVLSLSVDAARHSQFKMAYDMCRKMLQRINTLTSTHSLSIDMEYLKTVRIQLLSMQLKCATRLGKINLASDASSAVLEYLRDSSHVEDTLRLVSAQMDLHLVEGYPIKAEELGQGVLDSIENLVPSPETEQIFRRMAESLARLLRFDEAIEYFQRASDVSRKIFQPMGQAKALLGVARMEIETAAMRQAWNHLQASMRIFVYLGNQNYSLRAQIEVATYHVANGQLTVAQELMIRTFDTALAMDLPDNALDAGLRLLDLTLLMDDLRVYSRIRNRLLDLDAIGFRFFEIMLRDARVIVHDYIDKIGYLDDGGENSEHTNRKEFTILPTLSDVPEAVDLIEGAHLLIRTYFEGQTSDMVQQSLNQQSRFLSRALSRVQEMVLLDERDTNGVLPDLRAAYMAFMAMLTINGTDGVHLKQSEIELRGMCINMQLSKRFEVQAIKGEPFFTGEMACSWLRASLGTGVDESRAVALSMLRAQLIRPKRSGVTNVEPDQLYKFSSAQYTYEMLPPSALRAIKREMKHKTDGIALAQYKNFGPSFTGTQLVDWLLERSEREVRSKARNDTQKPGAAARTSLSNAKAPGGRASSLDTAESGFSVEEGERRRSSTLSTVSGMRVDLPRIFDTIRSVDSMIVVADPEGKIQSRAKASLIGQQLMYANIIERYGGKNDFVDSEKTWFRPR